MKRLLLVLTRLCVGWGLSPRLIGLIAAAMLVLLRVTVGWHFYSEGIDKQQTGNFSAVPFLANARGPLAQQFRSFVWDGNGAYRLNRDAMVYTFAVYRDQVGQHFGFDDKQAQQAQRNFASIVEQYDWILESNSADIEEFELGRQRVAELSTDPQEKDLRDGVASLGGQRDTIRREWNQKGAAALAQISDLWGLFESMQNEVATEEQLTSHGKFRFLRARTNFIDSSVIDQVMPWFDLTVGLLLLLGLFTPIAALAAAGFLFSVFLSQFPPTVGPGSSNYQLVESMACLVLASTGAGRFAGLDYFLHLLCRRAIAHRDNASGRDDKD